jgi:hypothetical protein
MASVFAERYAQACRRHPDLVAVHESPNGDIALVLRHTLVPLPEEHAEWRRATRAAARDALDDLRGAGFEASVVVAQWLPVPRLARIFDSWPRRWEGDPTRAAQLRRVVRQLAADQRFLEWRSTEHRRLRPPGLRASASVGRWYTAMAPLWLRLQPEVRRQLVLQTHAWIIERVQASDTCPPPADDLSPDGALAHRLERLVPPDERARWRPWIDVVLTKLGRALERAPERRDRRWLRSLFLVAYDVPPPVGHGAILRAL